MAKSPTYMMPRNKTGIFASEFQSYATPANKYIKYSSNYHYNFVKGNEANQKRLTQFDETQSIGYRQHSAFKVRVKPRQVMSVVNTKLIEQKSRPQSRTALLRSQASRTKSGASSARIDIVSENNDNKTESNYNPDYESSSMRDDSDNFTSTKDMFRPSTVRTVTRRPATVKEKPPAKAVENIQPVINIRVLSSKSNNTAENSMANRRRTSNNTPMSLSTPSLIMNKEEKPANNTIHYVNLNSENTIIGAGHFMYNHNLSTSHQQHSNMNPKASYNSISSSSASSVNYANAFNSSNMAATGSHSHLQQTHQPRSENQLKTSNLLDSMKISTEPTNTFDASSNLLIKNLNEEDFIKLLKEYRQTKSINITSLMPKNEASGDSNTVPNRASPPSMNHLNSSSSRLLSARNVNLNTPTRSQLFPTAPLPSKMETLTLMNDVESNYQLSSRVPSKSSQPYSIESLKNILKNNLENPNNRAPKFYINYLNNRFDSKNQTERNAQETAKPRAMTAKHVSKLQRLPPRYEKSATELTRANNRNKSALITPRQLASAKKVETPDDFGEELDANTASDSNMSASARMNKMRAFNFPEMAN